MGKSIWCSSASRSRKSSSTSWTTSSMRASGRSTLLTTSTTGSRASRALRSTNRVWGSGPSEASTRSRTPSTMVRPRSTSPPKSAWPGVSMMLILTPLWSDGGVLGQDGDALLPLQVAGVHDPLVDRLVGPEGPGLPEHGVDQGGLAVVDVGHDGHVADVVSGLQGHKGKGYPAGAAWSDRDGGAGSPAPVVGRRRHGGDGPGRAQEAETQAVRRCAPSWRRRPGGLGGGPGSSGPGAWPGRCRCSSRPRSRASTTACPGSGSRGGRRG